MNPIQTGFAFGATCAHIRHSITSALAAEQIAPTAGTIRAHVLDCIRSAGSWGCTDEEICHALSLNPSTQRPRRVELVRAGLIMDSCTTRRTASGRQATVWFATK